MRIKIKEDKSSNGKTVYYKSQVNFGGEEIYSTIVSLKIARYVDEFQNTFYLLYDSNYNVVSPVYRFINDYLQNQSVNSKEMALVALRKFYAYCELFNVTPEKMTALQVRSFLNFLYGINSNGDVYFDLKTKRSYQMTKNGYIPKDRNAYDLSIYQLENIQYVYPKIAIMVLIDKYIEEVHGNLSDKNRRNYSTAIADINDENKFSEENNYYIFLNKNAEPLSKSGWNKILREIFNKVGVNIDFGKRKNNLSHRFRHGYAMYLVKYRNYTPLQLKDALRHKSISTVMIYYNPTEEDIYEVNKEAADTLYEIFPGLLEVD